MRKNTFLKAVSLFVCLSILMLSVPGVIAAERPVKHDNFLKNILTKIASLLPFMNLEANVDKGDTSSDTTSDNDSNQIVKITGNLRKSVGSKGD